MRLSVVASLAIVLAFSGCSSVAEKAEGAANRSFTSYALGRPYAQVAGLGQSPMDQLAGNDRATFGPMLGSTQLANGMTIYRHMAPAARTETGSSFGGLVGRETVSTNNRLSYFLVGPDGIVKDWATGSVQGATSDCVTYIGGIINRCSDTAQLQAALSFYDSRVLTKDGQPITVWGAPAPGTVAPAGVVPTAAPSQ
ncbi:hypothetical protein [Ciceribacter sp. L1K22]|uniref:hypothetical protein n=1 Tax=Ciceribacter sp. L1K22 TaxID=2820275 RepID=UPI001ABEE27A|nr:hypothetical protein [Ciceribacter sp. L1K22]MBO3759358.1 hypothetical protein [Ciceribacter sp. L1K22]